MDKQLLMLNSILVALVVGFKEIAGDITDGQGLHETSLNLRLDDMKKLFQEACSIIRELDRQMEVQE